MRIVQLMFAGVLVASIAPALAKSSTAQKVDEPAPSSICSAYQQAPDGSWTQLPCKENGEHNPAPPQRHTAAPATTRTR